MKSKCLSFLIWNQTHLFHVLLLRGYQRSQLRFLECHYIWDKGLNTVSFLFYCSFFFPKLPLLSVLPIFSSPLDSLHPHSPSEKSKPPRNNNQTWHKKIQWYKEKVLQMRKKSSKWGLFVMFLLFSSNKRKRSQVQTKVSETLPFPLLEVKPNTKLFPFTEKAFRRHSDKKYNQQAREMT